MYEKEKGAYSPPQVVICMQKLFRTSTVDETENGSYMADKFV